MLFNFEKNIILEDRRVLLQPLQTADAGELFPLVEGQPEIIQYSPGQIHTRPLLEQYIADALADRQAGKRYIFSIFDKQAGKLAGTTGFGAIMNTDLRLEIGWTWLGKAHQRTGLNRHCKFLLLRYVFEELQFERVELKTDARNQQSRQALGKIGATEEGALRHHTLLPDGHRRDTVYYSILKREWPAIRQQVFQEFG